MVPVFYKEQHRTQIFTKPIEKRYRRLGEANIVAEVRHGYRFIDTKQISIL
jgi:hypothetical protein